MNASPDEVPGPSVARMPRADWILAAGAAGLTLISRWPFRARLLPTWDTVQFALALSEYDVVRHQPHPPGYILFVAAGRALRALTGDPTGALTLLAMLAGALTVLLVYRLAWELYGRATAALAALGLVASPLFWFYGVVGLSYTAEAALATAVALGAWRLGRGRRRDLVVSAVLLGLAGGVRQSVLPLLLPLWLAMAWRGFRRWPAVAGGVAVVGLTALVWLVPMVWLSGGAAAYAGAGIELYRSTVHQTTVLAPGGGWVGNLVGLGLALVLGVGLLLPVLVGRLVAGLRRGGPWSARTTLLVAWMGPAFGVYATLHLGQHGYLLTVLPALYIVLARGLVGLAPGGTLGWRSGLSRAAVTGGTAAVLLAHGAFFALAGPVDVAFPPASAPWAERWLQEGRALYRFGLWAETAGGLRQHERVIEAYVEAVRGAFDPTDTVLITELGNRRSYPWFRHVMYYLPEFTVYHLRLGSFSPGHLSAPLVTAMAALDASDIVLPASARRLVWVVDYWNPDLPRPAGLEARPLPYGRWLYVLPVGRRPIQHAGYRLTPMAAVAGLK